MKADQRLPRGFYRRNPVTVAKALLGQHLTSVVDGETVTGVIVETEAYLGLEDRAAHTFGGRRTQRVQSMWADGGTAYVYFTYGMHHCMNVVTETAEHPSAVLIRSVVPTGNLPVVLSRRLANKPDRLKQALHKWQTFGEASMPSATTSKANPTTAALPWLQALAKHQQQTLPKHLCDGPAKCCQAFGLNRADHDGLDLVDSQTLWLTAGVPLPDTDIVSSPRIGIAYAQDWRDKPLRFTPAGL